jgi:hypothetical protein
LVDRLPEEAPPLVVAVVGPPGVSFPLDDDDHSKESLRRWFLQSLTFAGWKNHPY